MYGVIQKSCKKGNLSSTLPRKKELVTAKKKRPTRKKRIHFTLSNRWEDKLVLSSFAHARHMIDSFVNFGDHGKPKSGESKDCCQPPLSSVVGFWLLGHDICVSWDRGNGGAGVVFPGGGGGEVCFMWSACGNGASLSSLGCNNAKKKNPLRIKILVCKLIYFWINVSHFVKIQVREKLCCYWIPSRASICGLFLKATANPKHLNFP